MKPVWIIDDDKSIRWVIEKALTREGIEYKSFAAAHEGLEALDDQPPQVVISDIRMPGTSGLDFMQKLKQKLPTTPVIIIFAFIGLLALVHLANMYGIQTGRR